MRIKCLEFVEQRRSDLGIQMNLNVGVFFDLVNVIMTQIFHTELIGRFICKIHAAAKLGTLIIELDLIAALGERHGCLYAGRTCADNYDGAFALGQRHEIVDLTAEKRIDRTADLLILCVYAVNAVVAAQAGTYILGMTGLGLVCPLRICRLSSAEKNKVKHAVLKHLLRFIGSSGFIVSVYGNVKLLLESLEIFAAPAGLYIGRTGAISRAYGEVKCVNAVCFEVLGDLYHIIDLQLTLIAVIVKKMYTKSNSKSIGGALTDLVDYLVDYAAAVFYAPTVFIGTLVANRTDELMQKIKVTDVELNTVCACPERMLGSIGKGVFYLVDLVDGQLVGKLRSAMHFRRHCGCGHYHVAVVIH